MTTDNKVELSEELRAHAVELAARVRFLREEIIQGRSGMVKGFDEKEELRKKATELGTICSVDASVATINFEIFDAVERGDGGVTMLVTPHQGQCLRIVEVNNPKRSEGATGVKTISLLPSFRTNTANLERLTSNILPQAMGGI